MTPLADRIAAALDASAGKPPPYGSDDRRIIDDGAPLIPAAVLVAIVDRPDPGVILTLRTGTLRRHAGQVAFPGGRIDPGDAGPAAAALREAEEEIALPRAAARVIGMADRYRTVTGYDVTPVLATVPPDMPLIANPDEVADWFEAPLAYLLDPANTREQTVEWNGSPRSYLEIDWQGRRIWGATAAMLANLAHRLQWQ